MHKKKERKNSENSEEKNKEGCIFYRYSLQKTKQKKG